MKVTFRAKDAYVSKRMEERITKKLSRLDKYFTRKDEVEARVLIKEYPTQKKIEITIPTDAVILRAEESAFDVSDAVDAIVEKLERQIRKNKTRLSKKSKNDGLGLNVAMIQDLEEDDEEDIIVRTKTISPKPMDLEEAVMQMELIGHTFFVYRDTETDSISVVYKRHDGGYGLLETE